MVHATPDVRHGRELQENIDLTFCTVNVFSRVSLIVSDILVIAVTWCATFKTSRIARARGRDGHHTLSSLLLRDGEYY